MSKAGQESLFDLDWPSISQEIVDFISATVEGARAEGAVVGLSGGVDSSVVAKLCVSALGNRRVLGVLMPTSFTPGTDTDDANEFGLQLGIRTSRVDIGPIVESFIRAIGIDKTEGKSRIPIANLHARVRMTILYFYANAANYLVAGTGDRSEDLIGYFTKYGDGGVDFLPISHLYKTQVRKLALELGIPRRIAFKPSSPQLYPGHKATDEIPADYDILDRVERMLFDERFPIGKVAQIAQVQSALVEDVEKRYKRSMHKRVYPPMVREW